jgi:hypothetical protein
MPQIDLALWCAARGWRVVINHPTRKLPLLKDWHKIATTDAATIRQWFEAHPNARAGVLLGPESGLIDLDCDSDEAIAMAEEWLRERKIEPLYQFASPNGMHFFIAFDPAIPRYRNGKFNVRVGGGDTGQAAIVYA